MRSVLVAGVLGLMAMAAPVSGGTLVAGKPAQALRCAAYIAMAARYGYDAGYLDERDAEAMTWWSAMVLDAWVPLPTGERLAAYRTTLRELGPRARSEALITRHAGWCVRTFTPGRS